MGVRMRGGGGGTGGGSTHGDHVAGVDINQLKDSMRFAVCIELDDFERYAAS